MCKALIFGGTTEGRLLAEYCCQRGIEVYVSVVSGYGAELLPENGTLRVLAGRMTEAEMEAFIRRESVPVVFDATHPYAVEVTENINAACARTGTRCLRVKREKVEIQAEDEPVYVHSAEEAAKYLSGRDGRILVTTGSKELKAFTAIADYEARVYARVLPSGEAVSACEALGIRGSHIVAMQGPFSEEMNRAVMNQLSIRYLVTKEAGNAGGFPEKMAAAAALGVTPVVVGRPDTEQETGGISVEEAKMILEETGHAPAKRRISLIGTGMGGPGQMTAAAMEAVKESEVLFGAGRMTESVRSLRPQDAGRLYVPVYESRDILAWLKNHPEYRRAGVLYSGDTGFYSGAAGMAKLLRSEPYCRMYEFTVYPGISSPSYLCAKLGRSWEHVRLVSLHGRACSVADMLMEEKAVFALLGGDHTVKAVCRQLLERGLSGVTVTVGERLSYPDERIVTGTPEECAAMEFSSLAVILIERDDRKEEPV